MASTEFPPLIINRNATINVWKIGEEQQPVFVVDNAFENVEELIRYAADTTFRTPPEGSFYPGLNAHLPPDYLRTLSPVLQRPMHQIFGVSAGNAPLRAHGFMGLSTASAEQMSLRQWLPHTDTAYSQAFASVHFLCEGYGGTAFYRHRATGFETVPMTRTQAFNTTRDEEVTDWSGNHTDALATFYEEIAKFEGVLNRLLFYRANILHSADLREGGKALSANPRHGRLTANSFVGV